MIGEKFYVYYYPNSLKDADRIDITLDFCGCSVTRINLKDDKEKKDCVESFTDGNKKLYPVLQIGDEKIFATLFNPSDILLKALLSPINSYPEAPLNNPTIYSTTWCGNGTQLKQWLEEN